MDGEADLVIGNLVLEHVADLKPVFSEAHRVLRACGLLYVCELHPYRQLRGSAAQFASEVGDARVEAYVHTTAEYVGAGLSAGFELTSMAEPADATPAPSEKAPSFPRLLQLLFKRRQITL